MKQVLKTIYKDSKGSVQTRIINDFTEDTSFCLKLTIDGVEFIGSSFDDFELIELNKYTYEQLARFTFNKVRDYSSDNYLLELCDCRLEVEFLICLINSIDNREIDTSLKMKLELGKPASNGGIEFEMADFDLEVGSDSFRARADMFEDAFDSLKRQFNGKYIFKNCYGCMYGDYSPYGNGFFGTMQCFKRHKKAYLAVESKRDILELADKGFIIVQETYCCEEFEVRKSEVGYR